MTARRWCITDHNSEISYDDDQWNDDIKYVVGQQEQCPTSGKIHWQVYMHTKNAIRHAAMRKMLPGAHIEAARGTTDENIQYCTKDDTYYDRRFEYGKRPGSEQGKRSDLLVAGMAIIAGDNLRDVVQNHIETYIKYSRGIDKVIGLFGKQRNAEAVSVLVWIGEPGTGKSYAARKYAERYHEDDYYYKEPTTKWWDGYSGQSCVIIDDFAGELDYRYLLRVLDIYPMQVETKGGSCQLLATTFLITSNIPVAKWYPGDITALQRRITDEEHL